MNTDIATTAQTASIQKPLTTLVEGDVDPNIGIKIRYLIQKSDSFIIYLDRHDEICWSTSEDQEFPDDYGMVIQRMKMLENLADNLFMRKTKRKFAVLLGEGFARVLDDQDSSNALQMFDNIERSIKQF